MDIKKVFSLTLFASINLSQSIFGMDDTEQKIVEDLSIISVQMDEKPISFITGGLPNELWRIILPYSFFNLDIFEKIDNIHDAISKLREYLFKTEKTILATCKSFESMKADLSLWGKEYWRVRYGHALKKIFLELRLNGLYPKNNEEWGLQYASNNAIAQFLIADNYAKDIEILPFILVDWEDPRAGQLKPIDLGVCKLIAMLLFYGANVDGTYQKKTALMKGSIAPCDKLVALLLDAGADTNIKASDGSTALIMAVGAEEANKNVVKLLLKSGANVNACNYSGRTALLTAIEGCYKDYEHGDYCLECYSVLTFLLLHNDIDLEIKDRSGRSAREIAKSKGTRYFKQYKNIMKMRKTAS